MYSYQASEVSNEIKSCAVSRTDNATIQVQAESSQLQSVSKAAGKQIGTQAEVTRNCLDSTSKHWYPSVSTNVCPDTVKVQSNHMWPVKTELRKSQVKTKVTNTDKLM